MYLADDDSGLSTVNGLPAHALLVHVVVVLVPLAALTVLATAVWPALRRRLGIITPILAGVALISVPITTGAGEWLIKHVDPDPLAKAHAQLGDEMLPWAIGLFVVAVGVWLFSLLQKRMSTNAAPRKVDARVGAGVGAGDGMRADALADEGAPEKAAVASGAQRARWVPLVAVVLAVAAAVASVGSVVTVYRIGESGAKAVWHDSFDPNASPKPGK
ncbi:MAG: hypothetical protein J2O49_00455 [Sciscionella sp.]|nr:hypothetical protein [Sciscionella sp.]